MGLESGFTLAELTVAAVVLLIAAVGILQSLSMMVRHSERYQRSLEADRVVRSAITYMRDVGYESLIASGATSVAAAIAAEYAPRLSAIASGAALSLEMTDTVPGKMLDATVSVSYPVDFATHSITLPTRVAKGGPL
ncbi:MAG: type II secretion system protein [Candidatus Sericytochromatia bacterium]|nr:type II secretion system protein [Candidatus Tanganyikabacteria bacterium]